MAATLLLREKQLVAGIIIEIVIWELSYPLPGCKHSYKYRLFCGKEDGTGLVRYDNERAKGDHRHIQGTQYPYEFKNIRTLIEDFRRDIREKGVT
ncbi:MAG: hypothetical protein C4530_08945 [Desulfobacteraceae bacterium]|nr:MAG: hypothetical protein C4530_08945 [Desulfobacteraceae bacterium]